MKRVCGGSLLMLLPLAGICYGQTASPGLRPPMPPTSGSHSGATQGSNRPNILFIIMDV